MSAFNLLVEYYKPNNIARHGELLACLHENVENPLIDSITVFLSDESKLFIQSLICFAGFLTDKIHVVKLKERPTFRFLFDYANTHFNGETCAIANADIVFDDSLKIVKETNLDNLFIALSRWNIDSDGNAELYYNSASQDVWIFKTPIKVPKADFYTGGTGGHDNRLAFLMDDLGYENILVKPECIKIKGFDSFGLPIPC